MGVDKQGLRTVRLVLSGRDVDVRIECRDYRDTLQYLAEHITTGDASVVEDGDGLPCVVNWSSVAMAYVLE